MAFVSYAQNLEDVILFRALKNVQQGQYLDIGANHPIEDSVTKAFYDRGWTGVNVEPVSQWFNLLMQERLRDQNLQVAISDTNQPLEFFEVVESGLSTLDPDRAAQCRKEGLTVLQNTVDVCTLSQLFDRANQAQTHFLKIDVEGAEAQVIASGDWERHRPWIVVVESTRPNTNISDHDAWEPTLLNHSYQFVWFDGINRFYLANEQQHLREAFRFPVNVLDRYVLYREVILTESRCQLILDMASREEDFQTELGNAKIAIESAKQAHDNALSALIVVQTNAADNNALITRYHNDSLIRSAIRIRKIPARIKRLIGRLVRMTASAVIKLLNRFPKGKLYLILFLNRHPSLADRLRWLAGRPLMPANYSQTTENIVR